MIDSDLRQIRNYLEIEPDIFTGGQPTPDQIISLGKAGFNIVINLSTKTSPDAISNEEELVRNAGMAYVHIPVEWQAPAKQDLTKFFLMFEQHRGFKTFVHCAHNMRVSVFIYLYRVIVKKLTPMECWKDVIKIWQPNEIWQKFLDQMLQDIHSSDFNKDWQFNWH